MSVSLLPLVPVGQRQKTAIANWQVFSNQGRKRNGIRGPKPEAREMCERGGEAAQLLSGPQAARFTKISSNTQGLHCCPLALSSLTLLRFLPLLSGHFSLFYLLRFVGVQRPGGWGTRADGWSKRGAKAEGESRLSWKENVPVVLPPWTVTPGQKTTWHNVRGPLQGNCVFTHRDTHT